MIQLYVYDSPVAGYWILLIICSFTLTLFLHWLERDKEKGWLFLENWWHSLILLLITLFAGAAIGFALGILLYAPWPYSFEGLSLWWLASFILVHFCWCIWRLGFFKLRK